MRPARSSTVKCFETAGSDMANGAARARVEAVPPASLATICRRVASASAPKTASRRGEPVGVAEATGGTAQTVSRKVHRSQALQ